MQFSETDQAGIVHFSWLFRYMEEAEHALWRAAGLSIAPPGATTGWPRVSASFEFRSPLYFEDEFEVEVRLARCTRTTVNYEFAVTRGDTLIGTGRLTAAHVDKSDGSRMRPAALPAATVERLRAVAERGRLAEGEDANQTVVPTSHDPSRSS